MDEFLSPTEAVPLVPDHEFDLPGGPHTGHAAALNVTDENTLTLIVPAAPSGPEDIVLERADGSSYTVENAVTLP